MKAGAIVKRYGSPFSWTIPSKNSIDAIVHSVEKKAL